MRTEHDVSREMRSAFVDGELDQADWGRIAGQVGRDETLRAEVCEIRTVKDLVRGAYAAPPRASRHGAASGRRLAAIAALCLVSAGAGWLVHAAFAPGISETEAALTEGASLREVSNERVVLHVSSSRRETLQTALDEMEEVLRASARGGRHIKIEIVANSSGLDLLRTETSPFPARIATLRAMYSNLTLVACNQTIDRLREKGITVHLLPGVQSAPTALDQIVKRLQGGWAYVRV